MDLKLVTIAVGGLKPFVTAPIMIGLARDFSVDGCISMLWLLTSKVVALMKIPPN